MKSIASFQARNATQSQITNSPAAGTTTLSDRLAARGIQLTARRRIVLEILEQTGRHLDAASLLAEARKRLPIDRATIYRTLDLLKKEGLIDEPDLMHLRGEMHYYEARSGNEHFHLGCFGCGHVEEMATPLFEELKAQAAQSKDFAIETARLEIGGYCSRCAAKRRSNRCRAPDSAGSR